MEQHVLKLLANGSDPFDDPSPQYMLNFAILPVPIFLGMVSNTILICILKRTNFSMTRTLSLLGNLVIFDMLFSLNTVLMLAFQPSPVNIFPDAKRSSNFGSHEIILHIMCTVSALGFLSNKIVYTKMHSVYFVTIYSLLVVLILVYIFNYDNPDLAFWLFSLDFFIYFLATLGMAAKELHRLFRKFRRRMPNRGSNLRTNIARIYIYNWMITGLIICIESRSVYVVFHMTCYLSSFYIVLYFAYTDRNFKEFLFDLIKCRKIKFDAVATFDDDCSDLEDEPAVVYKTSETLIRNRIKF